MIPASLSRVSTPSPAARPLPAQALPSRLLARVLLDAVLSTCLLIAAVARADDYASSLSAAQAAFRAGDSQQALDLLGRAIERAPDRAPAYRLRAGILDALGRHQASADDYSHAFQLAPDQTELIDLRGSQLFKLGLIDRALADFDSYLKARPEQAPAHWRRGIALYYAGRYADGAAQFAAYQTFDNADVENVTWRFLCQARDVGVERARADLLPVGPDPRVPMTEIYALFAGRASEDDVLAALTRGNPSADALRERSFYGYLYLGLYHEATGQTDRSLTEIRRAVEEFAVPHYMADVARVHLKLRAPQENPAPPQKDSAP